MFFVVVVVVNGLSYMCYFLSCFSNVSENCERNFDDGKLQ